jgi:hypothetical protein
MSCCHSFVELCSECAEALRPWATGGDLSRRDPRADILALLDLVSSLSAQLTAARADTGARQTSDGQEHGMVYEVVESRDTTGEWRVEGIDDTSGDCYVTLFSGPNARARAEEYAEWKAGARQTAD